MLKVVTKTSEDGECCCYLMCCGCVLREDLDAGGFVCTRCSTFYALSEVHALVHKAIANLNQLLSG